MSGHSGVAVVVGSEPPAVSISWEDNIFVVFFSDAELEDEGKPTCFGCLVEDGDEQLARGLDLAKLNGQVDLDVTTGEWVRPNA